MTISMFLKLIVNNLSTILAALTIISFVINIIQYRTNQNLRYILDSIYQNCIRTMRMNEKSEKSNSEMIHILYLIRDQVVSGLRALGKTKSYGSYDYTNNGSIYRFCQKTYWLLMKIKEKKGNLLQKTNK